ncbi:MAG: hypothetical protein VKL42_01695 [Snowella sp.]|nr:hypothetical protein [Snowella sp.]
MKSQEYHDMLYKLRGRMTLRAIDNRFYCAVNPKNGAEIVDVQMKCWMSQTEYGHTELVSDELLINADIERLADHITEKFLEKIKYIQQRERNNSLSVYY